jgi:hypothetical protein
MTCLKGRELNLTMEMGFYMFMYRFYRWNHSSHKWQYHHSIRLEKLYIWCEWRDGNSISIWELGFHLGTQFPLWKLQYIFSFCRLMILLFCDRKRNQTIKQIKMSNKFFGMNNTNAMDYDQVNFDNSSESTAPLNTFGEKTPKFGEWNNKPVVAQNVHVQASVLPVAKKVEKEEENYTLSDISDDEDDNEEEEEVRPKKKGSKRKKGRTYVKGGSTTIKYKMALKFFRIYTDLKMQHKNNEEIKKHMRNVLIQNSLSTEHVTAAALTMQNVCEDMQKLDEDTADEIGLAISNVMDDEQNSNYDALKAISSMNYSQLDKEFKRLTRLKQDINFQMKSVLYAQHLLNDPKSRAVELTQLLFQIVAESFTSA